MAQWIGYMVSIECSGNKGMYQGEIINATVSAITLSKAFCDGIPCENSTVTILANEIAEIKLIEKQSLSNESSTITIAKPIAKRANRAHTVSESSVLLANIARGPNSQNAHGPNSQNTHGQNSHGQNSHGSNSHGSNSQGSNSQGSNSHGSNSHGSNSHGSNSHGSNFHGSNSHGSNSHGSNSHGPNPHVSNSQVSNSHGANSHGSNSHGSNSHGQSTHGQSTHGQNSHGQNTHTSNSYSSNQTKSKPIDIEQKTDNTSNANKIGTPNKRDNKRDKGKWAKGWKDEACFGSPLDSAINKDFDFEKNLALFDKQAVYDEINSQKPDVVRHTDQNRRPPKYRHDENVIASGPATYRQIAVPKQEICEYVTDDGLIIPSVSRALRNKLWAAADKLGLTWERRMELMGRAATEISLQLLGGGHRLNPRNTHQWPTVVVLCGPHRQGAMGINTARQLATHGVHTVLYAVSSDLEIHKQEMALYKLTKNKIVSAVSGLPHIADLIIVALSDDNDNVKMYGNLVDWSNGNRAPVLALDPPVNGSHGILTKFSLVPVLPLPHSSENGKIYLCNLGFPLQIFQEVGIKYQSPFGPKFVIPLHTDDDS